jgi:signal transduction histidine kinase
MMDPGLTPEEQIILIVDDNPTNLGVISDYLKEFGFRILIARSGESALARAARTHPDLILLDVMMPPGQNGFETCRQLKADETLQEIPVIFMTALSGTEEKVEGFRAGAVDYITKPIQREEVLARVLTHLRLRNLTKNLQTQNLQLQQLTARNAQLYESEKKLRAIEEEKARVLAETNASKDKFFSIVAHDLKGPFQSLLGGLELLGEIIDTYSADEIKMRIESTYRSAENVYSLLDNLLRWSRMQMARIKHKPMSLDLKEAVNLNFWLLTSTASNKNITLHNGLKDPVMVFADEDMLHTVLRNLLANAIKFTPPGGTITVSACIKSWSSSNCPEFVEVAVADNGVGIAAEDLQKLFKLSTHHSTAGTAAEHGTGLGLIICQEMVVLNGGEIWVESAVGHGTTVKFTLPLDLTMGRREDNPLDKSESKAD